MLWSNIYKKEEDGFAQLLWSSVNGIQLNELDLIVDEAEQGGDYNSDPAADSCRQLVAQALAPSSWHQHKRVIA